MRTKKKYYFIGLIILSSLAIPFGQAINDHNTINISQPNINNTSSLWTTTTSKEEEAQPPKFTEVKTTHITETSATIEYTIDAGIRQNGESHIITKVKTDVNERYFHDNNPQVSEDGTEYTGEIKINKLTPGVEYPFYLTGETKFEKPFLSEPYIITTNPVTTNNPKFIDETPLIKRTTDTTTLISYRIDTGNDSHGKPYKIESVTPIIDNNPWPSEDFENIGKINHKTGNYNGDIEIIGLEPGQDYDCVILATTSSDEASEVKSDILTISTLYEKEKPIFIEETTEINNITEESASLYYEIDLGTNPNSGKEYEVIDNEVKATVIDQNEENPAEQTFIDNKGTIEEGQLSGNIEITNLEVNGEYLVVLTTNISELGVGPTGNTIAYTLEEDHIYTDQLPTNTVNEIIVDEDNNLAQVSGEISSNSSTIEKVQITDLEGQVVSEQDFTIEQDPRLNIGHNYEYILLIDNYSGDISDYAINVIGTSKHGNSLEPNNTSINLASEEMPDVTNGNLKSNTSIPTYK